MRDKYVLGDRLQSIIAWTIYLNVSPVGDFVKEILKNNSHKCPNSKNSGIIEVVTINSYNRLNIAFKMPAGDYKPGQFVVHEN